MAGLHEGLKDLYFSCRQSNQLLRSILSTIFEHSCSMFGRLTENFQMVAKFLKKFPVRN